MIYLLDKGDTLEYRCYRLFQRMGYLVRRRQSILTKGGLNQVTDIDLYGVKFNVEFSKDIVIVECKNRKRLSPLDRILWLRGLKEIVGARSAYLVVPDAKWDIKDYAFGEGIKVIDSETLDSMEFSLRIDQKIFYGLADFSYYEPVYLEWKSFLTYSKNRFYKILEFLTVEAKTIAPHKGINRLFSEIKWILPALSTTGTKESRVSLWVLYEVVICMSTFLLSLCEYIQILNETERKGYLDKSLTYGDWKPAAAEDLLKTTWDLARRLSKEQLTRDIQIPPEFFKFPKPHYCEGVAEVVERFCKNPKASQNINAILDMILFEFLFKGKQIDKTAIDSYFNLGADFDMSIKQAKNVIDLIVKYGGVPEIHFRAILDL